MGQPARKPAMPRPQQPSPYVDYGQKEKKYRWTQTEEEMTVWFRVPEGTRAKDIEASIEPRFISFHVKGMKYPKLRGKTHHTISVDDSTWTLDDNMVEITLVKPEPHGWWKGLIFGHKVVDPEHLEGSKFVDAGLLARLAREKKEAQGETVEEDVWEDDDVADPELDE